MKITFFFAALFLLDLFTCCHAYPQSPLPDIDDAKFIEDCVRAHNTFRSKVKPPASNMLRMSWDAALAKTAKAWAKKCKFKHNIYLKVPRKVHPTFTPVGENIWTGTATIFSVDRALDDWFNEVSSYDFNTNSCTGMCGHYTQVVWAESYKVGCAVHFCDTVENFPGLFKAAHFVCDYGPAGNYPRKPYKAGEACSGCSNEKCVDKLCENTEREKLLDYTYWYPDWDTQPQPPRPRPPKPPAPPHVPPAEHPRPSCDRYCLTVSILRPLLLVLSAGAVLLVQQRYPHTFFYE
ncbi:glioma pathogenesis-related protein 1-like [Aquila chrysaetos chrysaetos]|uniref:Glioma pathogenesis-related protein 1-like n=1 Tax=Aquila chrysaetos chrysaetos TaxID=223781 RepID=A0A663EX03_AQUCH|nr:glioma pathogenesis-related protein 1-like [Aquila chrysaetos chrysaetos]